MKSQIANYLKGKYQIACTVEPLLRGHPDERPPPLERPLDNVNLNINVLIFTPDERPPFLKGHFSGAKGVAPQEGFHCNEKGQNLCRRHLAGDAGTSYLSCSSTQSTSSVYWQCWSRIFTHSVCPLFANGINQRNI